MTQFPSDLRAIFFDMDGVLYDSMKRHEQTWRQSFEKFGIDFPAHEAYMNEGRTGYTTIELTYRKYLKREASLQEKEGVYNEKRRLMNANARVPILPGMQQLLKKLTELDIQAWVVTGSRQASLIDKLQQDFDPVSYTHLTLPTTPYV
jgi:beta-phosphoglucomutase-like phosphatase (HAD superfamily)